MRKLVLLVVLGIIAVLMWSQFRREPVSIGTQLKNGTLTDTQPLNLIPDGTKKLFSSNPYDYIKDNPAFDHLRNLPEAVRQIVDSPGDPKSKNDKLSRLGLPAIPFIMDEVQRGKKEIVPALDRLLKQCGNTVYKQDWTRNVNDWIKVNKIKFDGLRKMVEDAGRT